MSRASRVLATAAVTWVASSGAPLAHAQGVRGWVGSTVQMVELRPFGSEAEERTVAATEDLALTAWGLGVEGLSITTLLRARARFGGDLIWPRSDDDFDALLAYAQWARGAVRVRVGRQELHSGLGFAAFDGGAVRWGPGRVQVEGYGGRSLARGLREPAHEALRGLDAFVPDEGAYLLGAALHARREGGALTARYHREILADRSSLVSERASMDVSALLPGTRLSASLDYDFAFGRLGKGHLSASVPLGRGRWMVEAGLRRYVPYFELSTIWGFFQPVAYHEVELRAARGFGTGLGLWTSLGWRRYGDAGATIVLRPLGDTGWRAGSGGRWSPAPAWTVDGRVQVDRVPGGFLSALDATARFAVSDAVGVAASFTSFQQIEEFRVGDGRALGGGLSFDVAWGARTTLSSGLSVLRHAERGGRDDLSWSQTRAWSSLRVAVGQDPGLARRGRR